MFDIKKIEINICLAPGDLGESTLQAIERNLKESLTDRVIHNVGLVVSVYDILEVGEGTVFHSEGGVHFRVHCRPVVFCPLPTELIVGTISQMNEKGLRISLGFFEDVFIPPELLQQPAEYVESEREWCWKMDEESEPLYYSLHGQIRLKVHTVQFSSSKRLDSKELGDQNESGQIPRMVVIGRVDSTGLGMIGWEWSL